MLKHFLSSMLLLLGAMTCLAATPKVPNTAPVSPPAKAVVTDSVALTPERKAPAVNYEAMEADATAVIAAREAALAGRFLTEFAELPEAPKPDRMNPVKGIAAMAQQMASNTAKQAALPRNAFHIPGDSVQMMAKDFSGNGKLIPHRLRPCSRATPWPSKTSTTGARRRASSLPAPSWPTTAPLPFRLSSSSITAAMA